MFSNFIKDIFVFVEGIIKISLIFSLSLAFIVIIAVLLIPENKREYIKNNFVGLLVLPNKDDKFRIEVSKRGLILYLPSRESKIKELIKKNEIVKIGFFHPF
eukprot:jgi/Orpsp1_1/1182074/evm.model.c7180000079774.1